MLLRVKQIAGIVGDEIIPLPDRKSGEIAAILTNNLDATTDANPGPEWKLNLVIGEGKSARTVTIECGRVLSRSESDLSKTSPVFLPERRGGDTDLQLVIFRDRIFSVEPVPRNEAMREEAALRIKRQAYSQDAEVASLKSYIANVEAAIAYQSGPKREPIPDDVKMLVWARDGGACTRCGAKSNLHFDHIIPVVKGGSGTAENIQVLCMPCNLRKSDKIAF